MLEAIKITIHRRNKKLLSNRDLCKYRIIGRNQRKTEIQLKNPRKKRKQKR